MEKIVFKFVFNRKNEVGQDGKALVQLYVYRNFKVKYFSTKIYLYPEQWKGKRPNFVRGENADKYNQYFTELLSRLETLSIEQSITDEVITDLICGKEKSKISFVDFMIETASQRNDISIGTYKHVKSVVKKLKENNIVLFSDLTVDNMERLQNALLKTVKASRAHKIHSIIKAYLNIAIRRDLFPYEKNPYLKLSIPRGKSEERRYLTPEELKSIEDKMFDIDRMNKVKDLFLFSCYTGLSYSDMQDLTTDNIIKEGDTEFIRTFRNKTDEKAIVYLFEKARFIIDKYKDGDCLLPKISNQRLNSYLKEIADVCGIKKNLTFHMSRHTFATTVLLLNKVDIKVVSKALGHTSVRTTELYAKVMDKLVAESMKAVEGKI
jgi:site-specific recombinase XerD